MSQSNNNHYKNNSEGLADIGAVAAAQEEEDDDNHRNDTSSSSSSLSSWRQLLEISNAGSRKIRGSNYVQIATTAADGTPRCRTVVFRGFLPNNVPPTNSNSDSHHHHHHQSSYAGTGVCDGLPCVMKMITDARSQKVQEIQKSKDNGAAAEMVWWFPKTSEQYRIRGQLVLVGPNNNDSNDDDNDDGAYLQTMRREQWGNLSDAAREAFYDTLVPGQAWSGAAAAATARRQIPTGGRDAETGKVLQPPPDHFLFMLLRPRYCDYLRLGSPEQYRQIDQRQDDGTWTSQRVNP